YEKHGQKYPASYVPWTENRNMEEFLRLVSTGQAKVAPLVTHTYPLEQAAAAYQTILNPESGSLAVLLQYGPPPPKFEPRRKIAISASGRNGADLRVGLIGAGNLARWAHLPNLKKAPNVTLRAVHSTSGARGRTYAERFGATYCCSDVREILDDP